MSISVIVGIGSPVFVAFVCLISVNKPTSAAVDIGESRYRRGRDFILCHLSIYHSVECGLHHHKNDAYIILQGFINAQFLIMLEHTTLATIND